MRQGIVRASAATLALALSAQSALAANPATTTIQVTATVLKACTVTATALAFGAYTPTTGAQAAASTLTVACTRTSPYTVALNKGTTAGGTIAQRLLANGANTLNYNLYTNVAHTVIFGDGVTGGVTVAGVGTGLAAPRVINVYGLLPDNAFNRAAVPGNYADTVTVTVTY